MKDGIGDEVGEACPTIGSVIGTDRCHNAFNSDDDDDGNKIHPTYIILLLPEAKVVIINGNFVVAATA